VIESTSFLISGAIIDRGNHLQRPHLDGYSRKVLPIGMRTFEYTPVRSFLSLLGEQPVFKALVTGTR